jgi:hypothetical protein
MEGKSAVFLFQEPLRSFPQGLNHEAAILIEHAVGPSVLRERIVQISRDLAEL